LPGECCGIDQRRYLHVAHGRQHILQACKINAQCDIDVFGEPWFPIQEDSLSPNDHIGNAALREAGSDAFKQFFGHSVPGQGEYPNRCRQDFAFDIGIARL
jgi:hypothetical protein